MNMMEHEFDRTKKRRTLSPAIEWQRQESRLARSAPRKLSVTRFAGMVVIMLAFGAPMTAGEENLLHLDQTVHEFVRSYCLSCHGQDKEEGDRTFHDLSIQRGGQRMVDVGDPSRAESLREILDQLNLGEMPPKQDNVKRPSDSEVKHVVAWLTKTLLTLEQSEARGQTVLRRLNRNEYRNTVRDLLGLYDISVDPTVNFPEDDAHDGFINLGDALNLSDAHLAEYLAAADEYLGMALHFGESPASKLIQITPKDWGYYDPQNITPWMYKLPVEDKYFDIGSGRLPLSSLVYMITYPRKFADRGGIQHAGYYTIRVSAEAIHRLTHGYDTKLIPTDLTVPMRLGLYVADSQDGLAAGGVNARRRLASWDLADHEAKTFEKTVWLAKGAIPFVHWENGPGESDYWMRDVLKRYHTDVEFRGKEGKLAWHIKPDTAVPGRKISDVWRGPRIRIHDFSFTGPLPRTYMSRAQQKYVAGKRSAEEVDLDDALKKFIRSAFRRPVNDEDVAPYVQLAKESRENLGRSPEEAIRMAFKAVLVSPDFLYLKEAPAESSSLSDRELANRLSYFLWSSMPDDELSELCDSGKLRESDVLHSQVARLIEDPKADAFIDGFCTSWLQLDKLGSMPPDEKAFALYYRNDLEAAMRQETRLFARHVLRNNRPVTEFLDAKYTFLNQNLARHYGIRNVEGGHFRRVDLPKQGNRGGLLGQASVLTLSANGVDTTPVVRGVWVLEALLGTPPSPPPPDVEPLDPDVRGASTIRERLAKHRDTETCRGCHAKIDPYGFPLEYYDAIGGFRPNYYRKVHEWKGDRLTSRRVNLARVDGSAKLPSGEKVEVPEELKQALLKRKDQFARSLTEKLLTYACGRVMTLRDRQEIDRIATECLMTGGGFRDLVQSIVASETFQNR